MFVKKSAKPKTNKETKTKTKNKRRYVESHWFVFMFKGIIALVAGAYLLFSGVSDVSKLIIICGSVLVGLAIVEILNIIYRRIRQHDWGIPLGVAIFEAAVGVTMICMNQQTHVIHIALLAGYALVRGVASIVIGFVSFSDMTDRFLWVACGIAGSVLAFVIFADPGVSETTFIKVFGTFLMVMGLTDTFFAIHSRDEINKLKSGKKSKE
jgi:uncharacterized membrane protein HdeD (DUF308 family)